MRPETRRIFSPHLLLLGGVCALLSGLTSCSPKPIISGRVVDSLGHPLTGARIDISGTNLSTTTDGSGAYRISFVPGTFSLHVSHPACTSKSVPYNVSAPAAVPAAEVRLQPMLSPPDAERMLAATLNGLRRNMNLIGETKFTNHFVVKSFSGTQCIPGEDRYEITTLVTYISKAPISWRQGGGNAIVYEGYHDVLGGFPDGQYPSRYRFARLLHVGVVPNGAEPVNLDRISAQWANLPASEAKEPDLSSTFPKLIIGAWRGSPMGQPEAMSTFQFDPDGTGFQAAGDRRVSYTWRLNGDRLTMSGAANSQDVRTIYWLDDSVLHFADPSIIYGSSDEYVRTTPIAPPKRAADPASNHSLSPTDPSPPPFARRSTSTPASVQQRAGTGDPDGLDQADAELNQVYKSLMDSLNPSDRLKLRTDERDWLKRVDADANRNAQRHASDGTVDRTEFRRAKAELTRQRTAELRRYQDRTSQIH